jgi:hypothetical protein
MVTNLYRHGWKAVLNGDVVSPRNENLSKTIAQSFLAPYIQQNQDLVAKVTH